MARRQAADGTAAGGGWHVSGRRMARQEVARTHLEELPHRPAVRLAVSADALLVHCSVLRRHVRLTRHHIHMWSREERRVLHAHHAAGRASRCAAGSGCRELGGDWEGGALSAGRRLGARDGGRVVGPLQLCERLLLGVEHPIGLQVVHEILVHSRAHQLVGRAAAGNPRVPRLTRRARSYCGRITVEVGSELVSDGDPTS